eukprot:UN02084
MIYFIVFLFYFVGTDASFSKVCEVSLKNTGSGRNDEHPLLDQGNSITYVTGTSTFPSDVNLVKIQNLAHKQRCVVTFYADTGCSLQAGTVFAHNGRVRSDIPVLSGAATKCVKIAVLPDTTSTSVNCKLSLFSGEDYSGASIVKDLTADSTLVADENGYFSDSGGSVVVQPSSISLLSSLSPDSCWVMVYGDTACSDAQSIALPRLGAITGSAGVAQLNPLSPRIKCIKVAANEIASIPGLPTLIFHNPLAPSYVTISVMLIVVMNILAILGTVWYCTCKTKRHITKYFTIPSYRDSEIDGNTENE